MNNLISKEDYNNQVNIRLNAFDHYYHELGIILETKLDSQ